MDNQTRELIENVIAIGVEYGVDIAGAIVLLVVGWTVAGWIRRVIRRTLDSVPVLDETLKPFIANWSAPIEMHPVYRPLLRRRGAHGR